MSSLPDDGFADARLPSHGRTFFHERRQVPWWWWAIAIALLVPSVEAVVVLGPDMTGSAGWLSAVVVLVVTVAVIAAVFAALSRSAIEVGSAGLRAGRYVLPATTIGRVRVLDPAAARDVLGPSARADARLCLLPWIKTAVQVEVVGDDSAAPYWVVATRHPAELAAALTRLRAGSPQAGAAAAERAPTDSSRPN